jgi:hypothetical protein
MTWARGLNEIKPEPLTEPKRPSRALNAETRDIIGSQRREAATRTLETHEAQPEQPQDARTDA